MKKLMFSVAMFVLFVGNSAVVFAQDPVKNAQPVATQQTEKKDSVKVDDSSKVDQKKEEPKKVEKSATDKTQKSVQKTEAPTSGSAGQNVH